jgi:hypothetical protein
LLLPCMARRAFIEGEGPCTREPLAVLGVCYS